MQRDHHHLTIRPEGVWFAILVQLSCYINNHAEELRSYLVAHGGKKHLEVDGVGNIGTVNFGAFAEKLAARISDNVVDSELPSWILPSFSTTTDSDSSHCLANCRTGKIYEIAWIINFLSISEELQKFRLMLVPILDNFILSFEQPQSIPVKEFWDTIATIKPRGSGAGSLLGWNTAFCYWDKEGVAKQYGNQVSGMGDVSYPKIDTDSIPVGYSTVPVRVNDNGKKYDCELIAGSVGIIAHKDGDGGANSHKLTRIQLLTGWWICERKEGEGEYSEGEENELSLKGPDWYQNYKNKMRIKAEREQQREEEATVADLS